MTVYLESSAILAWLLGEPSWRRARAAVRSASAIVTSALTLVECERALIRAGATGRVPEATAARRRARLREAARHWTVSAVTAPQMERAREPFPREPVRTLDALHLAAMLRFRAEVPGLSVVSLDERIRGNAELLGFDVHPAPA